MSALTDPIGGGLDKLVEMQRGMTEWEADWFMRTGQLPDLSQPPVEEPAMVTQVPAISEDQARSFLAGELTASARVEAFDFDPRKHPRDEDGRWATKSVRVSLTPEDRKDVLTRLATASRGKNARKAVPSVRGLAVQQFQKDPANTEINFGLRTGAGVPGQWQNVAAELDNILSKARTKKDVTVLRGTTNPRDLFGDAWDDDGDNVGLIWEDKGFTSSTVSSEIADFFAKNRFGENPISMEILIPKGSAAAHLDANVTFQGVPLDEVLTARGSRFRIVEVGKKPTNGSPRKVYAEMLPPDFSITAAARGKDEPEQEDAKQQPAREEREGWKRFIDSGPQVEILHRPDADDEDDKLTSAGSWGSPSELVFRFDPDQPRDGDGRWTSTGGGGLSIIELNRMRELQELADSDAGLDADEARELAGLEARKPARPGRRGKSPQEVLETAPVGIAGTYKGPSLVCRPETLSVCAEANAKRVLTSLLDYRGVGFKDINGLLRRGETMQHPTPIVQGWVDTIDGAMETSRLPEEVQVMRGLQTGRGIFGPALDFEDDLTGYEWTEKAYVSTTTDTTTAEEFGEGGVIMNITVPAGTGAIQLSNAPTDESYDEAELLLERGLKMRVVRERERDRSGRRILDVEVVAA